MKLYIQCCGALQWIHWRSYLKPSICSCLASYCSGKGTKVGSPPNFPMLISQLWEIPQPQYLIKLSLDLHRTYFRKHYIYYIKDTKIGSQNFGYQIWFCTKLLRWSPRLWLTTFWKKDLMDLEVSVVVHSRGPHGWEQLGVLHYWLTTQAQLCRQWAHGFTSQVHWMGGYI